MYGVIEAEVFRPNLNNQYTAYIAIWLVFTGEKLDVYKRPWVARIIGPDPRWGLEREFLRGTYDYTRTNGPASRGTRIYYAVPPGIYEVCRDVTWRRWERFFCRVDDNGDIHKLSKDEVIECLKNAI